MTAHTPTRCLGDTGRARRVLVVDDHPMVAPALRLAFRTDGRFELSASASTGAEALELLDGADAVLLDLRLPDAAGADVAREIRRRRPGLPVIAHSAAACTPEAETARPWVDGVVAKAQVPEMLALLECLTAA